LRSEEKDGRNEVGKDLPPSKRSKVTVSPELTVRMGSRALSHFRWTWEWNLWDIWASGILELVFLGKRR
jgi:hypothetical protein